MDFIKDEVVFAKHGKSVCAISSIPRAQKERDEFIGRHEKILLAYLFTASLRSLR